MARNPRRLSRVQLLELDRSPSGLACIALGAYEIPKKRRHKVRLTRDAEIKKYLGR